MTNRSAFKTYRSRLAVAAVGLGLAVAGAACSEGNPATSPSAVSPASLAGNPSAGQDTKNFKVTITPASVHVGETTLHVTVTIDTSSGKSQQLGSAEIYVPAEFTIQRVKGLSDPNWMLGVSGQTVRVGADAGNHKLNGDVGRMSVSFDIDVKSTKCGTFEFGAKAANNPFPEPLNLNWTDTGSQLFVEVTGCESEEADSDGNKAAPAIANAYLKSIDVRGQAREDILKKVAQRMTNEAAFPSLVGEVIAKNDSERYEAAVIAYVKTLLPTTSSD